MLPLGWSLDSVRQGEFGEDPLSLPYCPYVLVAESDRVLEAMKPRKRKRNSSLNIITDAMKTMESLFTVRTNV